MFSGGIRNNTWKLIAGVIAALGIYATIVRFSQGLGASTNLSDEFPWGLWIGFDILVGVGLAAGGFVVASTVHIFNIKRYEPVAPPAILTAFLGYSLVIFALMFDLGRPYRIWHPLVMGNPHSVMFEVAMCVMLYTMVLALEFSPLVLKRFNLKAPLRIVRAIYIPLVIAGVLLSTLHQSSLGTMYVIVPDKLHGLWYTPMLPVFFFISAIAAGLSMTIFESYLSSRAFGRRLEADLLEGMARVSVVVLALLLVWKFQDLAGHGNLGLAFQITPESVMFWGEIGLGVALPMVLFAIPRVRESESGLFFGALLTVMGFIINRLNVAITGMAASSGVNYVPHWMEFTVTAFIIVLGFVLFRVAVKHLQIFPIHEETEAVHGALQPRPIRFRFRPIAAMWVLLVVGAGLLAFANHGAQSRAEAEASTGTPVTFTATPVLWEDADDSGILIKTGKDSPGPVYFLHSSHVDERSPNCVDCHSGLFHITREAIAAADYMLMEDMDNGRSCGTCHNGDDAFASDDDCEACHRE